MICRAVALRQPYNGRIAATLQRGANETATAIPFCQKRETGTRKRNKKTEKLGVASRGQEVPRVRLLLSNILPDIPLAIFLRNHYGTV